MITCIIIDDEKLARDSLELMIIQFFPDKISVLDKSESLREGVFSIYKNNPDLVFLDIEMKDENGFNIFRYFTQVKFAVIFTTAYKDHAIRAIKVAALDYILKPVSIDDLKEAISLYEKKQISGVTIDSIDKLITALNPSAHSAEKIALPTFSGFQLEKVDSIIYCEADQNYTRVYTVNGEKLLVSKPLNIIQDILPGDLFFRIHKSCLVNLNYIKTYSRVDGFHIKLENGKQLTVATRRNEDFIRALTHRGPQK
jgi:two-component system, LytTR family, response regulator